VGWGATWKAPGISELTSKTDLMTFDIGEISGDITDRIHTIKDILEQMCPTIVLDNLMGIRWTKLLINSTFSGMSAVLGCTFGDVVDNEKTLLCAKHIANECIATARCLGIKMEPIQGQDIEKLLAFKTKEERDCKDPIFKKLVGPHRKAKVSMLQDLEKGRRCEIDAINGVVCESGKKCSVPTPVNDTVVEIIKGIESGKFKYEFSNIELFNIP